VIVDAQAQNAGPAKITDFKRDTLRIYKNADTESLIETIEQSDLATGFPWDILDYSDNGIYQVEIDGQLVWVVDRSVKVDFSAMGSALNSSTVNFANPEHAGSRGYGD
jgi:hypothetical protein